MVMETNESFERYEQGLLRAASCCRELGKMTNVKDWKNLSRQLMIMLNQGRVIYQSAPLTELQVMALVTNMEIAQLAAQNMRRMG